MNILLVHEHYQYPGGEDAVFTSEGHLLEAMGHHIVRLEFDNTSIPDEVSVRGRLELAANTIWSRSGAEKVHRVATEHDVDVVHFHNTFPLVSPAAYVACQHIGVPVVQTLHNYRLLCPAYNLLHDGHICEDCIGKAFPFPGVIHGCYRHSRAETLVTATMLAAHRARKTWSRDVNRYIALTEFAKRKFIEGGLPEHLITVKPNFVPSPPALPPRRPDLFLFVGRLSPEKGLEPLLEAVQQLPDDLRVRIVGQGELADRVRNAARSDAHIDMTGPLPHPDTILEMGASAALVFPSIWYEGFPMTIVEAFSCGTPVIASSLGSMAEIVTDGVTGLHFAPGDAGDLAAKIGWAAEHPDEMRRMGENARREYEEKYTPERNYSMLMNIYESVIAEAAGHHHEARPFAPTSA